MKATTKIMCRTVTQYRPRAVDGPLPVRLTPHAPTAAPAPAVPDQRDNRSPGSRLRLSDAAPGIRHGAYSSPGRHRDLDAEPPAVQLPNL